MPPGKAAIVPLRRGRARAGWRAWCKPRARAGADADRAGQRAASALEVRWWRDDWPQATLRIEADGLRWIEHDGRIRHAPLDPASLQRLRKP